MGVAVISTCHPNRFAHCKGLCKSCYDKHLKEVNPEYRQRQIKNTSEWMKRNPDKRKELNRQRRIRELNDPLTPIKKRANLLKKKYGLTLQDYDALLVKQNGGCALCFRHPGKFPLHVDHSHVTQKVRGLLCHQCNWYLGVIEADVTILNRIQEYLK